MEHEKIPIRLNLAALLAVLFACALFKASNACAATGDDLAQQLRDNVVKITSDWNGGHSENGFGFIVGERSGELYIATANHVVRRTSDPFTEGDATASRVRVEYFARRGVIFDATVLVTNSADDDLAVLRAPSPQGLRWIRRAVSPSVAERSMPVWFVGRTGDWYVPSRPGAINNVGLDKRIAVDDLNVQVGTSGAPLIGENGILGMIVEESGGIAYALPIEFIEQAFHYWNHPWQLATLSDTAGSQGTASGPCRISGLVFNSENNRPLSGIWVDLYRDVDAKRRRPEQLKVLVATTGPDGRFSLNCSDIADSSFPLLLALRHRDWVATRITGQSIASKGQWEGINIPIQMSRVELVPLREIGVSFGSKARTETKHLVEGNIQNNSDRSFACIRITFQLTKTTQSGREGAGSLDVVVRNLAPGEKRPYVREFPPDVGFYIRSKSQC